MFKYPKSKNSIVYPQYICNGECFKGDKTPFQYHMQILETLEYYRKQIQQTSQFPKPIIKFLEQYQPSIIFGELPELIESAIIFAIKNFDCWYDKSLKEYYYGKFALSEFEKLIDFFDTYIRDCIGHCKGDTYNSYLVDLLSEEYIKNKDFEFVTEQIMMNCNHSDILKQHMDNPLALDMFDLIHEYDTPYRSEIFLEPSNSFYIEKTIGIRFLKKYPDQYYYTRIMILYQYNDESLIEENYHKLNEDRIYLIPLISDRKFLLQLLLFEAGSPKIRKKIRHRLTNLEYL